jgi:hypothetical protein
MSYSWAEAAGCLNVVAQPLRPLCGREEVIDESCSRPIAARANQCKLQPKIHQFV